MLDLTSSSKKAMFYENIDGTYVQCLLCLREDIISFQGKWL